MTTETQETYLTRAELEASTGKKYRGTYVGPFDLYDAKAILDGFQHSKHRGGQPVFPGITIVKQGDGYNVIYEDLPEEDWHPIEDPKRATLLNPFINTFGRDVREATHGGVVYDGHFQTGRGVDFDGYRVSQAIPTSFHEVGGWNEYPYRAVWLSDELMSCITFCEGDVHCYLAPDEEAYRKYVQDCHNGYVMQNVNYYRSHYYGWLPPALKIAIDAIEQLEDKSWKLSRLFDSQGNLLATSMRPVDLAYPAYYWLEAHPDYNDSLYLRTSGSGGQWINYRVLDKPLEEFQKGLTYMFDPTSKEWTE